MRAAADKPDMRIIPAPKGDGYYVVDERGDAHHGGNILDCKTWLANYRAQQETARRRRRDESAARAFGITARERGMI